MDGGEFYDIDAEIERVSASVPKPGTLVAAERDLAVKETEIARLRAELRELAALAGKDAEAGRARQRLVSAMAAASQLMNASQPARVGFYRRRAEALRPIHQRGVDEIAGILDLILPGVTWTEVMAGDRMRLLIGACNRLARTITTWTDVPKFVIPMREEGLKNIIARHRSR